MHYRENSVWWSFCPNLSRLSVASHRLLMCNSHWKISQIFPLLRKQKLFWHLIFFFPFSQAATVRCRFRQPFFYIVRQFLSFILLNANTYKQQVSVSEERGQCNENARILEKVCGKEELKIILVKKLKSVCGFHLPPQTHNFCEIPLIVVTFPVQHYSLVQQLC